MGARMARGSVGSVRHEAGRSRTGGADGRLRAPRRRKFAVVGQDPILASPHYLGNGAAVTRLLTGLAANELWRIRTGRSQDVEVDARHAAAALRSYRHARPVGQPALDVGAVARRHLLVTRIVAARDGRYVQLHVSFGDGPAILSELGLDESSTAAEVDAAVAGRDAFELEAALIARRVCGGVVRSRSEWAEHPQGRSLAGLPVVTITRIGDAPPEPLPDGDRPASGVRIVDLTRVLAGPTCAKTIAEHGADVLHISAPHLEGSLFDLETGIGKRQAAIDLNVVEQAETMRDLIRGATSPLRVTASEYSPSGLLSGTGRRSASGHRLRLGELRWAPGAVVRATRLGATGPSRDRDVFPRRSVRARRGTPAAPVAVNDDSRGTWPPTAP